MAHTFFSLTSERFNKDLDERTRLVRAAYPHPWLSFRWDSNLSECVLQSDSSTADTETRTDSNGTICLT